MNGSTTKEGARKRASSPAPITHASDCKCDECAAKRARNRAPALIGYARVSTLDQTTRQQIDALEAAGCAQVFIDDGVSGATTFRPELGRCLAALQSGDTLVVWSIDRLGRSLPHLLDILKETKAHGVAFKSITQGIDTSSPCGEMIYAVLGAVAQFERALTIERINAAKEAKRSRGERIGGRNFVLGPAQIAAARKMLADPDASPKAVAKVFGCSRTTLWRAIRRADAEAGNVAASTLPPVATR